MLFWLAVIAGLGLAYVGLKKGFLPMWAACFNVTVSIYLGVMLLPVVAVAIPGAGAESWFYSCAACMLLIPVLTFAVLQPIASTWFSGGYAITFPKVFNTVVAAVLGFVCGYVATSFILLVISFTPITAHSYVKGILDERTLAPAIRGAVTTSCNIIGAASVQIYPRKAIDVLADFSARRTNFLESAAAEPPTP
jgi:hypothetical protein